jgi:branched-subunit amino acid transport protein AzlD
MLDSAMQAALIAAAVATASIRIGSMLLAKSPLFAQLKEETLSRVFPLVILFILILRESLVAVEKGMSQGILQVVGIVIVSVLHLWKRNLFLSVIGGTAIYLVLRTF